LKAQVNYKIQEFDVLNEKTKQMIAYEFQEAVVETLGKKLLKAAKFFGVENVALVG
jgi:tRNA A37 threonylcarbamoyltransferase TsaD